MDTHAPVLPGPKHWFDQALAHYHRRQLDSALRCCDRALDLDPAHAAALDLAGVIAFEKRDLPRAIAHFTSAALASPGAAVLRVHLGNAQLDLGDLPAALASYETALTLDPAHADAHYGRGNALFDLGRLEEAIASFDVAIRCNARFIAAHDNRALAMVRLGRFDEALAGFDEALALDPRVASVHCHRGSTLIELKRPLEALAAFEKALALDPAHPDALVGSGNALAALDRPQDALDRYDRAIGLDGGALAAAHLNRGNVLERLGRDDDARRSFERALESDPTSAIAHKNLGDLERQHAFRHSFLPGGDASGGAAAFEKAIDHYRRALALNPNLPFLRGMLRLTRMQICDWRELDEDLRRIAADIERDQATCPPFCLQALADDPPRQLAAARIWSRSMRTAGPAAAPMPRPERGERIRIGYFSPDFRVHPVSLLIAEMLERHDRSTFEVFAFSLGRGRDPMRERIERAVEHFVDVCTDTDRAVVRKAREMNLEIAVDLSGYTENCRPGIFELRAAPIQVGYIGSLGTSGAPYMDYLMADQVLIPPEERAHYCEQILYLPSYQANDSQRSIAASPARRAEVGLPEQGFVFSCFNTNYKIVPAMFDSWMRILAAVPGSVLFLGADSELAAANLRREAARRNVDPGRLVFGGRLPYPNYLARYRLADLFLDTFPYNAGATASDALWAGLPVITLRGRSMHARMASSLLTAADLPELVTTCREDYERRAIGLALDPGELRTLRDRLISRRADCLLFDTPRFTRALEHVYRDALDRHARGQREIETER